VNRPESPSERVALLQPIVDALAEIDDPIDYYGSSYCFLCGGNQGASIHRFGCCWVAARRLKGLSIDVPETSPLHPNEPPGPTP